MKFFTFYSIGLLLCLPFTGLTQTINDCVDAVVVCSDDDIGFNPDGPGQNDYADPDNNEGCITSLEQNSAWYYFQIDPTAPPDLVLGFILHPKGGLGEDYDWALYGPNVPCGNLGNPIRCSSSSAACGFCPDTGMGMGTTDVTEGPGSGDGFVMTLVVQPGQGFYLMIDNWQGTMNGFVLTWTDSAAPYLNCAAQPPCALEAHAGPNILACEGDQSITLDGTSSNNHDNETYSWSGDNGGTAYLDDPDIANPTVTLPPGFTGIITYTLTVTEDTCTTEDQLTLEVFALPTITITQIGPFCENNPPQALTATPPGGTWSGDNTGNTFNPTTNGPGTHTVTYTYTDNHGCINSESLDIEVFEKPEVTIDPDPAEFCDSEGFVLLTAEGSAGAGGYSYNWTTPTGMDVGNTYNATVSGAHIVSVTDANGCKNTSSVNVINHPNPYVEIIDPGPICDDVDDVFLTAIPAGGTFGGSIITPDGEINPNMNPPGTYPINYSYTDGFGCESTALADIFILETPNATATNNGPLCGGEQILLFGETDGVGANIVYSWTGPGGYISTMQNPVNASAGGFYNLYVTVEGCVSEVAVTQVDVSTTPDAVASNDGPYCNGQSIQLHGNTTASGIVISYAWTGPNGYTSTLQHPTDATQPGIYSLVITVDGCPSPAVLTQVQFNPPPGAAASNNGPYCTGDAIALFGNTSTSGTTINYTWSGPNGYQSTVQNPTDALAPGVYQLIVTVDGCQSAINTTTVTVNSLPQPVIAGQASFCTGNSAMIDAGGGYTSYFWNDASTNQTIQVFATGIYTVTVTDANGCTGNTSFGVTEMPSLSPVITGALEFCEGSNTVLDAGTGYTTYQWSTGEVSQTIQVSTEGNIGVIVTDAQGCSGSTNITTSINPNPIVTIGGSTTYCIGGFTVLDAGTGYISYDWSNSATTQTITVSAPGAFSVDVVDVKGCAGSGSVTITESTSLSPVITGSTAFCENGSTTLNAGSGFATYNWSDGSMNQTLLVNTTGIYSVSVSDGQGCFGNTSVSITEVLPPSATLKTDTTLCNTQAGGSVINLYSMILSGDTGGTWEDVNQSGAVGLFNSLNFNNIPAGDYRFRYTTNSATAPCPESEYQIIVKVLDCTCPDVFFLSAAPLCNGGDVLDLTTIENTAESGVWSVIQNPAGINPASLNGSLFDPTGSDPGAYTLQFDLQNQPPPGCPVDFQVMVDVDPSVDAGNASAPVAFCVGDNQLVNLNAMITGADANGTWTETSAVPSVGGAFNSVNGTFNTQNQPSGNYTFQYSLTSNGVCPDDASTVSVIMNLIPKAVAVDNAELDCTNTTRTLDATGSSDGPGYSIVWTGPGILSDGKENTIHPTVDQPGIYVMTITNTQTGCFNSTSVTVTENGNHPTDAVIDTKNPSCSGDQDAYINVNQVIGGVPPYAYSLNNQPFTNDNTFTNLTAGDYDVALADANGCLWDTLITITSPSAFSISLGPDIELGLGESATVQATTNLATDQIDTMIWSPANLVECFDVTCLEGTVHAANAVTLTATLYDINGCSASDKIYISVNKVRKLYVPTVFSPNSDGVNDIFYISGNENQITQIKRFMVFNRWGEVLHEATNFQCNDASKGWDGFFKNETMNPGVFVYFAEVEYIDGWIETFKGDVTLMR